MGRVQPADPRSPVAAFVAGFSAPVAGLRYMLAHPALWRYAVWPVLINLVLTAVVLGTLVAAAVWFAYRLHPWLRDRYDGSAWGVTLEAAAAVGLLVAAVTAALVTWVLLGGILAGHFNSKLVRQVEIQLGTPAEALREVAIRYQVADTLRDLAALLGINAGLLVLNVIPGLGSVAAAGLGVYLDGFLLGFDYVDLPMALRGMRRADKLARARRHRWETTGLGTAVLLLNLVPVVGAVLLATAAVGATLMHRQWIAGEAARA
ncbi:MAG TPA: EI24 domain-containing protein [Humisphaera sp.]